MLSKLLDPEERSSLLMFSVALGVLSAASIALEHAAAPPTIVSLLNAAFRALFIPWVPIDENIGELPLGAWGFLAGYLEFLMLFFSWRAMVKRRLSTTWKLILSLATQAIINLAWLRILNPAFDL